MAQISCQCGKKELNITKMEKYADEARKQEAELIIFPELSLTGYTLKDKVYELAETIPGPSTEKIARIAKENNLYIIFGAPELSEKAQAILYNTAVLVGPEGYIGKYRKMHLPNHSVFEEKRYFRPGYKTGVYKTRLGRIGLIICYDIFFPEITRLIRLEGADFTVCISASPSTRRSFFEILTAARAIENTMFLAYVNLVGIEEGLQFWGGSRLIAPNGNVIAKAPYYEESLTLGEIDYNEIRASEISAQMLKDLRPEIFLKLKEKSVEF
ncbi:MAG: carbon-nitrogen hydrolase family protein [Candidatus Bathyarchaeia archaeon]